VENAVRNELGMIKTVGYQRQILRTTQYFELNRQVLPVNFADSLHADCESHIGSPVVHTAEYERIQYTELTRSSASLKNAEDNDHAGLEQMRGSAKIKKKGAVVPVINDRSNAVGTT